MEQVRQQRAAMTALFNLRCRVTLKDDQGATWKEFVPNNVSGRTFSRMVLGDCFFCESLVVDAPREISTSDTPEILKNLKRLPKLKAIFYPTFPTKIGDKWEFVPNELQQALTIELPNAQHVMFNLPAPDP